MKLREKDKRNIERITVFSLVMLLLFFVFYFGFVSFGEYGLTGYAVDDGNPPNISKEVEDSVKKGKSTRIVVNLENQTSRGILRIASVSHEDIKNEVLNKISKKKIKHDFNETLALEISEKELEELRNSPYIESIEIDRPVRAFLQDSVPLVNATDVWNAKVSGNNITGEGETVCVLDTGINFSHPDLQGKNLTCNVDCLTGGVYPPNSSNCVRNCSVTDGNGHGTHVAGIIAANGNIKGVAKGVNLIGVKVLADDGGGYTTDVKAGMDWCNNHADEYNITAMSLSLGITYQDNNTGYPYYQYCDSDHDSGINFVSAINTAVSKNITVAIATGNDGYSDAITAPACIENATAVGSSTKNDEIVSGSNRWNLSMLLAPGRNVNSTMIQNPSGDVWSACGTGKRYCPLNGTSMATPHVAGAAVLLQNFERLESRDELNVSEIEKALNETGKRINDPEAGRNFSRIDVFSSIEYFDSDPPAVNLVSPSDNSYPGNVAQNLTCNASNFNLENITLKVWNNTGFLRNESSKNISGSFNETLWTLNFGMGENYSWNCYACDSKGYCSYADANYSFRINSPPVFNNSRNISNKTWEEDTNISINLTGRFYDNNDVNLSYNYSDDKSYIENLSLIFNQTSGIVIITPEKDFFGLRNIIFTATDSYEVAESNNVSLNITPVNDAPYFTNLKNIKSTRTYPFSYDLNAEDVDDNQSDLVYDLINYTNLTQVNVNFSINSSTGLLENNSDNSVFSKHRIYVNVTDGINTTIENFNVTFNSLPRLSYDTFSPNLTTNISGYNETEIQNVSNFTIGVEGKGVINYSGGGGINLSLLDIDSGVVFLDNHIEVNSTLLPELNKSARLTFYGISYTDPGPLRDGTECSSDICTEVSYNSSSNEYIYNVTKFTVYSTEETYEETDNGDTTTTTSDSPTTTISPSTENETTNETSSNDTINESDDKKIVVNESELQDGKEIQVSLGEKFYVEINSTEYEIEIINISILRKKVGLNVSGAYESLPSNFLIKFDLDNNGFYDLEIESISFEEQILADGSRKRSVVLKLSRIHSIVPEDDERYGGGGVKVSKEEKDGSWWKNIYFVYIGIAIFIVAVYFIWIYLKDLKKAKESKKSRNSYYRR